MQPLPRHVHSLNHTHSTASPAKGLYLCSSSTPTGRWDGHVRLPRCPRCPRKQPALTTHVRRYCAHSTKLLRQAHASARRVSGKEMYAAHPKACLANPCRPHPRQVLRFVSRPPLVVVSAYDSTSNTLRRFDTTLTPLRAQHPATVGKTQKRKRLRYAGVATVCNVRQHPFPPLQGGGRWFEPSIAHLVSPAKCGFSGEAPYPR